MGVSVVNALSSQLEVTHGVVGQTRIDSPFCSYLASFFPFSFLDAGVGGQRALQPAGGHGVVRRNMSLLLTCFKKVCIFNLLEVAVW